MTRKKPQHSQVAVKQAPPTPATSRPQEQRVFLFTKFGKLLPYLLSFLTLWIFCTFTYGDVFTRTVQESFVCSDTELMKHLTDQEHGQLYLIGRYLLLMFHSKWLGGFLFSLILTIGIRLFDYALRIPKWLHGISALIPFGLLLMSVNKGINLYFHSEPSLFMVQGVGFVIVASILAVMSKLFVSKLFPNHTLVTPTGWRRWSMGSLIVVLTFIPLNLYTQRAEENTILTARMQNLILENNTFDLVEEGLSAKQPSRAVAAYYAIGLVQTGQILEHLFDISFHFPEINLKTNGGTGEYGIFNADCNFYSGLINASYRCAMDQFVMRGHSLYALKRMALCSIINEEKELANKYLDIISKVPFEDDFIKTYQPMVDNPNLIQEHPSFKIILELYPEEQRFEQNYRSPAFLGYNVGMMQGHNMALPPSMAACMYSKDLGNLAMRAAQYKQITGTLPMPVLEALSIYARKSPDIYQYFPELNDHGKSLPHPANVTVNNFYLAIQNYYNHKYNNSPNWRENMSEELSKGINEELRSILAPEWIGHYVYYYYCENMVTKQEAKKTESSVN